MKVLLSDTVLSKTFWLLHTNDVPMLEHVRRSLFFHDYARDYVIPLVTWRHYIFISFYRQLPSCRMNMKRNRFSFFLFSFFRRRKYFFSDRNLKIRNIKIYDITKGMYNYFSGGFNINIVHFLFVASL